jgi:hypothetical protein
MDRIRSRKLSPLIVDYKSLKTISVSEFRQALWEDIKALSDFYNVHYTTGPKLIVPCTNEFGDPVIIKHPDGHVVRRYDTHYYRPACLDYHL